MTYRVMTLAEHFAVKAQRSTGCWIWTGWVERGYGHINFHGQHLRAHRVSYELHVGEIPAGMTVDHLCHNADLSCLGSVTCRHRRCVNPEHLGLASIGENNKRSLVGRPARRGRARTALIAQRAQAA